MPLNKETKLNQTKKISVTGMNKLWKKKEPKRKKKTISNVTREKSVVSGFYFL